jgi:hypothetical protein
MPALKNQRHEKFVLALFEGKSASEAYVIAGFKPCRQNASRLMAKDDIRQRLAELQTETAATAKVTLQSIYRELDDACAVAKSKHQAQAMVSAASMKAKLAGLLTERVEIGGPGSFDGLTTKAEIVDRFFEGLIERFLPIDNRDKQAFVEMIDRQLEEQAEFMRAIESRPILAERVDPRNLTRPWDQLQPYTARSSARIGYRNGSKPT